MKKLSAVLCTVVMLFCTSCDSGLQELQAPKSIDDMKIEIKDSHVQAYLSETFQIDADLTGADISKLPSYNLYAPRISNDKIAEIFMPGGGYKIEDKKNGAVEYTKDKEKLFININEKTDEPSIKYYLDKDKGEAYGVVANTSIENLSVEATETAAADLVKEKLDMLSVEYSDLKLQKLNFTEMNERYTAVVKREQSYQRNEYDTTPTEEPLDEHFKFTAEDDCYVITGTMILKGLPVYHPIITNDVITNIRAAVSSRGIEYLSVNPLYSAEDANHEAPVIPVEKAIKLFCKAYSDSDASKDTLDITVDNICLSYQMDNIGVKESQKGYIDPIWAIGFTVRPLGGKETDINYRVCKINASDGEFYSTKEWLFQYIDYDQISD